MRAVCMAALLGAIPSANVVGNVGGLPVMVPSDRCQCSISGKMFGSTPSIFTVIGAPQVKWVSAAGAANIHRPKPRSAPTRTFVGSRHLPT